MNIEIVKEICHTVILINIMVCVTILATQMVMASIKKVL